MILLCKMTVMVGEQSEELVQGRQQKQSKLLLPSSVYGILCRGRSHLFLSRTQIGWCKGAWEKLSGSQKQKSCEIWGNMKRSHERLIVVDCESSTCTSWWWATYASAYSWYYISFEWSRTSMLLCNYTNPFMLVRYQETAVSWTKRTK